MRSIFAVAVLIAAVSGNPTEVATKSSAALRGAEVVQVVEKLPAAAEKQAVQVTQAAVQLEGEAPAHHENEWEKTNIEAEVLASVFFAASLLICVLECCPPKK